MNRYYLFTSLFAFFLISCEPVERSVGFTNWTDDGTEFKFHLGTENSINVVKKFDAILQKKDYQELYRYFADTAVLTYQNGAQNNLKQFIDLNLERDSILSANGETLKWEPQNAFSVDLNPEIGGEHVNMLYLATYETAESKSQFYADLWFYVVDGKIVTIRQFNQSIK